MNLKILVCSICLALIFAIAEAYPRACQYNRDNRVDDVSRCKYGWDASDPDTYQKKIEELIKDVLQG